MISRLCTAAFVFAVLSANAGAQEATANASFVGADGAEAGAATLTSTPGGVLIDVEVSGLPAGQWVGFHFHETGQCDHTGGHESAGGHFNPGGKEHGFNAANGPHAGDMPNQYVGSDGTLRAQVLNTFVSLAEGENSVQGRALMVHGGADDYESQPSGKAGERLACAVVE
ncbi:superoxide dismutase family protein [Pseudorhizobium flavum]|uniref:Cu-Zn family superoxide dismutase n=1 Tax=Pseudorhizobium flavum TaxID=1335061 RepID=A0A7X0DEX9_9HYPH|nr:superoxide dismutase family protein [Pseudorhizobium flavum]MBB6180604.1 Cu-Zn family superoxide dismutase [Pseudorhizobium flavum]CAD6615860.1 superoxide dismutase family protein [Pseudorhizobium flavum]